jgi:hypothetical protein
MEELNAEQTVSSETSANPVIEPPAQLINPPSQKKIFLPVFLVILLVVLALAYLGYSKFNSLIAKKSDSTLVPPETTTIDNNDSPSTQELELDSSSSLSVSGQKINIPAGWKISISSKSNNVLAARLFPAESTKTSVYVDVQIGPSNEFAPNLYLELGEPIIEGDLQVFTGKEKFLSSTREVVQVKKNLGINTALLTLYGDQSSIAKYKVSLIKIISPSTKQTYSIPNFLIPKVSAQESSTPSGSVQIASIAGFNIADWKEIEIMAGPYPERLSQTDKAYKEGFARLYTFVVLPGQRVEVLAEEGKEALKTTGSFIQSELYDQAGNLITKAGTRIGIGGNNEPPSGARYYLIVNSYPGKIGEFLLKVFDLDQVQDLYYAHYADGSELLINNPTKSMVSKSQPAVMIAHFTSPIEVVDGKKVRYFRQRDNSCINCYYYAFGDITIPYIFKVNNVETPIKITKLFLNQAIIEPVSGEGFPANSQISFEIDYGEDPNLPGSHSGYVGSFRTY